MGVVQPRRLRDPIWVRRQMSNSLPTELRIPSLGRCAISSPGLEREWGRAEKSWVRDDSRILLYDGIPAPEGGSHAVELAGPRREIYFSPAKCKFAVVTCGGLCPGINDVIRSLVMHAHYCYGVSNFVGIPYGYQGLNPECGHMPIALTPERVSKIQHLGGSVLGSSRGGQDPGVMVGRLEQLGVNALFVVGGDGSQRGARAIHLEAERRGMELSVVGIPKTIDNDLRYMDRSFGYLTAFSEAFRAVSVAHAEARGVRNGIGLVRLMGRDSGFIACSAAVASAEANFVLIPEVPFELRGAKGLLCCLERRLAARSHALIVVAEGAGQHLMGDVERERDASGNVKHGDIGRFLQAEITRYFAEKQIAANIRYIDPAYLVRGVVATPEDRVFCLQLARNAVHAAMCGKTGVVVASWHNRFVHLPVDLVAQGCNRVDPAGDLWRSVLESTGQPATMC